MVVYGMVWSHYITPRPLYYTDDIQKLAREFSICFKTEKVLQVMLQSTNLVISCSNFMLRVA